VGEGHNILETNENPVKKYEAWKRKGTCTMYSIHIRAMPPILEALGGGRVMSILYTELNVSCDIKIKLMIRHFLY
jgi:hypothetical protein